MSARKKTPKAPKKQEREYHVKYEDVVNASSPKEAVRLASEALGRAPYLFSMFAVANLKR